MQMKIGGWFSVGPEALKVCNRCHCGGLAWAKSSKTGRAYLCHTRRVQSDYTERYWVMPNAPHSCREYMLRVEADEQARQQERERLQERVRIWEEAHEVDLKLGLLPIKGE